MSHKNYHNYSKQYNQPQNVEPVEDETVETANEPIVDTTVADPEVDATVEETVEAAPELPTTVVGIVSACKKLNVRNRPSTTAAILTTINEGVEVEIAQPVVDGEFYKVTLANGTTGFCMKKFITVK